MSNRQLSLIDDGLLGRSEKKNPTPYLNRPPNIVVLLKSDWGCFLSIEQGKANRINKMLLVPERAIYTCLQEYASDKKQRMTISFLQKNHHTFPTTKTRAEGSFDSKDLYLNTYCPQRHSSHLFCEF